MTLLVVIWAVFAVIFLALGMLHWNMRNKSISHFQVSERPLKQAQIITLGSDLDQPIKDFARDFNNYIDYYNQTAKKQHKIQAIGYWVATAVALLSLAITLVG